MKLTKETLNAIKIINFLSKIPTSEIVTADEIAFKEEISYKNCSNILRKLTLGKIIVSFQGVSGGYRLTADKVTVLDVVNAIQGNIVIFKENNSFPKNEEPFSKLKGLENSVKNKFQEIVLYQR